MSWRKYFRTNLLEACDSPKNNEESSHRTNSTLDDDPAKEIKQLLEKIGDRDVVVDACLPPQLANDLRGNNINAVWVPAVLGDGASDEEIIKELLFEDQGCRGDSSNQKVLLTRDVAFYRRIEKRAILVNHRTATLSGSGFSSQIANRDFRKIRQAKSSRRGISRPIDSTPNLRK
jgi:hypothetical protein